MEKLPDQLQPHLRLVFVGTAAGQRSALNSPIDVPAFREKMLRYRPKTIAFTSKKAAGLFYGRPTKAVALGRQLPQDDFPIVFVLASPSGAATRYWSVQLWRELADSIPRSS